MNDILHSHRKPIGLRRSGFALATMLVLSGLLAGCGSSGSNTTSSAPSVASPAPGDVSKVTLTIGDQAGTGAQALLTAAGLIDKLPFTAKWADFTSGPPMLQAESAGSVDVGGVGNAPPVFAAAGGGKILVVGATKNNPASGAILVPKGSPITSVGQLAGKKIAVAQGSSAHYHVVEALTKAGIGVKGVDLDYLQPAAGLAALTSGAVDAWAVWSPYTEQAAVQHGARVLTTEAPYGEHYSFEVASQSAAKDPAKVAAISDYIRLLNQAYGWAQTHVHQWASVWSKATGLPEAVTQQAARDSIQTPVPITPDVIASEQKVVSAFAGAGLIPNSYDFKNFVYTGFNNLYGGS